MKKFSFKMLSLIIVLVLVFSSITYAAVQEWKAVKPVYTSYVNGTKVEGMEVMNIDGRTYLQPTALSQFGVTNTYDAVNKVANFTIPVASTVEPEPNNGGVNTVSDLTKLVVRFYKGNGQFLGNGIWVAEDQILTTKNVWSPSFVLKAKKYNGDNVTLDPQPIKDGERLVLLKTTGVKSKVVAELADKRPEAKDEIILVGALDTIPNMINFSTVKDYFDFNWLTTGDKEYLRSYNNCNQSCQGSGMYDDSGKLAGVFIYSGANYALSVTIDDIKSFLD